MEKGNKNYKAVADGVVVAGVETVDVVGNHGMEENKEHYNKKEGEKNKNQAAYILDNVEVEQEYMRVEHGFGVHVNGVYQNEVECHAVEKAEKRGN